MPSPKTGETNFYRESHLAPVSRIPPQPIAPKNLDVYALGVLQVWILSRNFLALCRTVVESYRLDHLQTLAIVTYFLQKSIVSIIFFLSSNSLFDKIKIK